MIHRFVNLPAAGVFAYHRKYFPGAVVYQQIWAVPLGGGSPIQLTTTTDDGTIDSDPDVSPNGSRVAFLRDVGFNGASLWIVNADGSGETQLDSTLGCTAPMWHPSGTKILYRIGGAFKTIEPDGTNKTDVSPDATPPSGVFTAVHPTWNRDGTKIGFHYDFSAGGTADELWVSDADGTNATQLDTITTGGLGGLGLSWMNSADTIAYTGLVSSTRHVFSIGADGTGKTQLTNTGISPSLSKYAWSNDDASIFAAQADASPWTMYDVDPGGGQSAVSPTLNGSASVGEGIPVVGSNGRVYVIRSSTFDLVSIQADGSSLRVEDTEGADFSLAITGNGTEL